MSENNDEILLRVEHLCQYFKTNKAVNDVSFEIKKGEVFGLVGESGCGKTTTGRSIIRLYNPTSGNIYFKGQRIGAGILSYKNDIKAAKDALKETSKQIAERKREAGADAAALDRELKEAKEQCAEKIRQAKKEIKSAKYDQKNCDKEYLVRHLKELEAEYRPKINAASGEEKKRLEEELSKESSYARKHRLTTQIQMIFQDPIASIDPRMTVREIIAEGLIINGEKDKAYIEQQVYDMLERVGLVSEHAGRYPHEFSGGQKQRIGVARAIIMKPDLIIADEPVSALDVSIQAQVINLLNDLRKEMGLTLLFIAHDLSVVKYFSDRIGVMYYGNLMELADSDELFLNPLHPYTRALLSAIPLPDPEYEKKRKRIVYNPLAAHDYTTDKPTLREVKPGHLVYCNNLEYERYMAILK